MSHTVQDRRGLGASSPHVGKASGGREKHPGDPYGVTLQEGARGASPGPMPIGGKQKVGLAGGTVPATPGAQRYNVAASREAKPIAMVATAAATDNICVAIAKPRVRRPPQGTRQSKEPRPRIPLGAIKIARRRNQRTELPPDGDESARNDAGKSGNKRRASGECLLACEASAAM